MNKRTKILIYGSGNVNPINILVDNLRKYSKSHYTIDGLSLYENEQVTEPYKNFDNIFKIRRQRFSEIPLLFRLKNSGRLLFTIENFNYLVGSILQLKFKKTMSLVKALSQDKWYVHEILNMFNGYDIVNVHCINEERASIISLTPKHTKVILSFWGSDLMAYAGVKNYSLLLQAIQRADIITLHSIEMREIFLSKFGREFKYKVRMALFGQRSEIFGIINSQTNNLRNVGIEVLHRYGFNANDYDFILKIGYSGFNSLNHLKIIEECGKLSNEVKKKVLLVVPMTYGATPQYISEVQSLASTHDLSCCVLNNYLANEEALSLSFVCNIMCNLRDNDAFNNSMIETLLAGNILVSGAWLPYSELRKKKVYFHEIYEFVELSHVLKCIMQNIKLEMTKASGNYQKVEAIVGGKRTAESWSRIYEAVLPPI